MKPPSHSDQPEESQRLPCRACRELIQPHASVCPYCGARQQAGVLWKRFASVLKWIGGVTAVLSLIASTVQLNGLWRSARETRSTLEKLLLASDIQQQTGQLDAALDLTHQALKLEPGSEAANRRRTEIAMAMVRRYNGFSGLGHVKEMKPLLRILYAGTGQSDPQVRSNVLAHIAWSIFLASTSSADMPTVKTYFDRAIELDPMNTYAHLFMGIWFLNNDRNTGCTDCLKDAVKHFDMAEATGEHQPFVTLSINRTLCLTTKKGAMPLLVTRLAARMKNNDQLLADRDLVFRRFGELSFNRPGNLFDTFLTQVKPKDALEVLEWAAGGHGKEDRRNWTQLAQLALVQERCGEHDTALAAGRELRTLIRREELDDHQFYFSSTRERLDWLVAGALGIRPGGLRIRLQQVPGPLRTRLNLAENQGVLVSEVEGAAARGGLNKDDVIAKVNGRELYMTDPNGDLLGDMIAARAGDTVTLNILRNGQELNLDIPLEERRMPEFTREYIRNARHSSLARLVDNALYGTRYIKLLGREWIVVEPVPLISRIYELPEGLSGILLFDQTVHRRDDRLRAGDLIVEVAGKPISGIDGLEELLGQAGPERQDLFVRVWRKGHMESVLQDS